MALQLRTLVSGEEERLLDLLDGWPFGDETRGSVFFRRYFEHDPSYLPENVWVACDGPQPVSCVQIFPRRVRVLAGRADEIVTEACGGIGTVFTEQSYRRAGLAGELLALSAEAMRNRSFGMSALLATRVEWYQSHGWLPWCSHQWRLSVADPDVVTAEPPISIRGRMALLESADQARSHLEAMLRLRRQFCRARLGVVAHDQESWSATLALSGNPAEQIRIVEAPPEDDGGGLSAYLRSTELYGDYQLLEWGRTAAGIADQAELFLQALRESGRSSVLLSAVDDGELFDRLRQRGCVVEREQQATWLLRSLDRRSPELEQRLPQRRFEFFLSDRF